MKFEIAVEIVEAAYAWIRSCRIDGVAQTPTIATEY